MLNERESLSRIDDATRREGKRKQCYAAIAERRGWKHVLFKKSHPRAGEIDWWTTYRRWDANFSHQLDPDHAYQLAVADLDLIEDILGYDPRRVEFPNAA